MKNVNGSSSMNLLIIMLLCFYAEYTKGQSAFEILNQRHSVGFKKNISNVLKTNFDPKDIAEKELTIKVASGYNFIYQTQYPLTDSNAIQFLVANPYEDYAILKKNDKVIGYGRALPVYNDVDKYIAYPYPEDQLASAYYMEQARMLEAAEDLSKTFFFIRFHQNFEPQPELIGIIKDGQLKIVDTNGKLYSITEYICSRYGSLKKYTEFSKKIELETNLFQNWISSIDSSKREQACIDYLRNYYTYYAKRQPADTAMVLKLFFNEMDKMILLEDCQKQALTKKLTTQLQSKFSSGLQTEFYGYDVSDIILSILTKDQIGTYEYNKLIYGTFMAKVKQYLFRIYLLRRYHGVEIVEPTSDDSKSINAMINDVILKN